MNTNLVFRGEQQAMSNKHTGIEPDAFNDYIRTVCETEVSQTIEITPGYLEANVDLDRLKAIFGEELVKSMNERLRSGKLASPEETAEMQRRITDIIAKRMAAVKTEDTYVWFTFRREHFGSVVDWPVAVYVGVERFDMWDNKKVEKALTTLKRNRTITAIRVTGKLPKHWYQTAL